jgi:hypothetical protein
MSSRYRYDDDRRNRLGPDFPPLPSWIAQRRLDEGEEVAWVHGPASHLGVERFITHIGLFFVALVLAAGLVAVGWLAAGRLANISLGVGLGAIGIVLGSVFVLALANGHFTRLVVTNRRLMIMQGYDVVRSWRIDRLPRSLIRFAPRSSNRDVDAGSTVDLDALKSILGGNKDQSATSRGIMALGKQVDRIRSRERDDDQAGNV